MRAREPFEKEKQMGAGETAKLVINPEREGDKKT